MVSQPNASLYNVFDVSEKENAGENTKKVEGRFDKCNLDLNLHKTVKIRQEPFEKTTA